MARSLVHESVGLFMLGMRVPEWKTWEGYKIFAEMVMQDRSQRDKQVCGSISVDDEPVISIMMPRMTQIISVKGATLHDFGSYGKGGDEEFKKNCVGESVRAISSMIERCTFNMFALL